MQRTPPATALAILATIVLVTTTAIPSIGSLTTQPDDEPWLPTYTPLEDRADENGTYTYTWDGPLPTSDYRRIETLTLPSLPDTPLEVVVETVDLFAEESNMTSLPTDDPRTGDRRTIGVAVEGAVNGHPHSRADLVITSYGVYGMLRIDDLKIDYTPVEMGNDTWVQNVTLLPMIPNADPGTLDPEKSATKPSDVTISSTHLLTPSPIEENQPFDVAVAVENAGDQTIHVLIDAEATDNSGTLDRQLIGPFEVVNEDIRVRNVTMELPRGTYNLSYNVHTAEHPAGLQPLDTATRTIEISRPLAQPPEAYVVALDESGTELEDAVSVEVTSNSIVVDPASRVHRLQVHQAWLIDHLASVSSDTRWEPIDRDGESWAQVTSAGTSDPVTFSTFELTRDPVFTTGDTETLQFTQRPMWVSLNAPGSQGQGDPPVVSLRLEDGDPAGQPIRIAKTWLEREGIHHARYAYPSGEAIPVDRAPAHEIIHPPHFSIVNLYEFDCADCDPGSPPPSTHWTDETSTGLWNITTHNISLAQSVVVKGGDNDDHKHAHRHDDNYAPPEFSFWGYVWSDDGSKDWHKFQWRQDGTTIIQVMIRTDGNDNLEVTTPSTSGWVATPYNTTEWLPVRVFNLDWFNCDYDLQLGNTVVLEDRSFANCAAYINELRIGSKGWGAERWWVDAIKYDDGNLVLSNLQFDISDDVVDAHNDYEAWVTNAFNKYEHVWEEAPLYIDLEIEHIHPHSINIITGHCDAEEHPRKQYSDWLGNSSLRTDDSVDAYQWWAGDLEGCLGKGRLDGLHQGNLSASVIEANKQDDTGEYDAEDDADRGALSGHELGHVYGEDDHQSQCPDTCNLMAQGYPKDFWFTDHTKTEIWTRFYFDAEYNG